MTDAEILELGTEAHALLKSACMESHATLTSRSGLKDAEEAFGELARWLEPRSVNKGWREMPLAAACLFIIATDPDAYRALFAQMPNWKDEEKDPLSVRGAWRLHGFLSAVNDDNDYSLVFEDGQPLLTMAERTLIPLTLYEGLREYAVSLSGARPAPSP